LFVNRRHRRYSKHATDQTKAPSFHHNPAYEVEDASTDVQLSNDSGCQDIAAEVDGGEYNTVSFQRLNSHQRSSLDATYSHITIGPTHAIETDNTHAHIPNTKAATFGNTYSNMSNQDSFEEDYVFETEDSTCNHLGEPTALAAVSRRTDNAQLTVQPDNGLTDDTYSHISANSNVLQNQKLRADYEDTTYNHLGDIPTSTSTKMGLSYGQVSKIGQSANGVTEQNNENRMAGEGRYNYAVVNKHPHIAKPAFHIDGGQYDYLVLEPDTETKGKPKPYDYAVVNKMPYTSETASPSDNGPHTDGPNKRFALVPNQSKATQPKPYDYAVVNKMSLVPTVALSPEDGPHEYYVLKPTQSKSSKP